MVVATVRLPVGLALDVTKVGRVGFLMVGSCCSTRSYSGPILRKRRHPSASNSASRTATSSSNEFMERCALVDISTASELVPVSGCSTSARSGYSPSPLFPLLPRVACRVTGPCFQGCAYFLVSPINWFLIGFQVTDMHMSEIFPFVFFAADAGSYILCGHSQHPWPIILAGQAD